MKLIAVLAFLLQASAASAQPADNCPSLPPNSGVSWHFQQGPDLGVCYAVDLVTKKDVFGVYLGFAPDFRPDPAKLAAKGVIGGHSVDWYRRDPSKEPSKFSRETLVKLDPQGSVAHVWVTANSEQQLVGRLAVLSHLDFGNRLAV
jgi:hypothetical protein